MRMRDPFLEALMIIMVGLVLILTAIFIQPRPTALDLRYVDVRKCDWGRAIFYVSNYTIEMRTSSFLWWKTIYFIVKGSNETIPHYLRHLHPILRTGKPFYLIILSYCDRASLKVPSDKNMTEIIISEMNLSDDYMITIKSSSSLHTEAIALPRGVGEPRIIVDSDLP